MIVMVIVSIFSWILLKDSVSFHPADNKMKAIIDKLAYVIESDAADFRKERIIRRLLRNFAPPPHHIEESGFQSFYLVNENEELRSGKEPPEAIKALLINKNEVSVATHGEFIYIGPQKVVLDGTSYSLFVSQFIGRFKGRLIYYFVNNISPWFFLIYLIVSSLLCFLLAWSISRPIKLLQAITHKVASGQSISAVELLGNRNDEFYHLASDFDVMSEKVMATISTQKQLLSDISHELRSPLARMQITLGLLEKKEGEKSSEYIQRLEKECSRIDEMLEQLLNIAALERGQVHESSVVIDIDSMLEDIIKDAAFEASEKEVNINSHLESAVRINGYFQLLYSAIENIIRNAIRYSENNSSIKIVSQLNVGTVLIQVEDNGPGVEPESLSKIFDPFYRTDSARTREKGGAGIGLAIAARAIQVHKGLITAENKEPHGLRVNVSIPISKES